MSNPTGEHLHRSHHHQSSRNILEEEIERISEPGDGEEWRETLSLGHDVIIMNSQQLWSPTQILHKPRQATEV